MKALRDSDIRRRPWSKPLAEMSKYDWLTACCHNPRHRARTRDLRVAIALMQLADADTCLAWPTQESLAELSGLPTTRQVRSGLASLSGTGAIEKKKVSELSEESRGKLAIKRRGRGVAYKLKLFWAQEILEAALSPATVRAEPVRLASSAKRGRAQTLANARQRNVTERSETLPSRLTTDRYQDAPNRTTAVHQKRTTTDRYQPDYDSPPNTILDTKDTIQGIEGKGDPLASSNSYAAAKDDDQHVPFPIPSDPEEMATMMASLFADASLGPLALQRMRTLLSTGRLTPAIVNGNRRTDAA